MEASLTIFTPVSLATKHEQEHELGAPSAAIFSQKA